MKFQRGPATVSEEIFPKEVPLFMKREGLGKIDDSQARRPAYSDTPKNSRSMGGCSNDVTLLGSYVYFPHTFIYYKHPLIDQLDLWVFLFRRKASDDN